MCRTNSVSRQVLPNDSRNTDSLRGMAKFRRLSAPAHIFRLQAFTLSALLLLAANAPASDRDPEKDLREANQRYDLALVAADTPALDALYLPEFTYIGPGGVVRNKMQQIQSIASGTVDVIEGRSDEILVRIYGYTAVLTGRFTGRARVSGEEFSFHERYSTVWIHRGSVWRLALEHGTVIKDE